MRLLRNLPIRRKLTVIVMLTSGVALLLACVGFVTYEQLAFRQDMVSELITTAEMVGDNNSAAVSFKDPASAEQTMQSLNVHAHIDAAVIYDADGKVFATYRRPGFSGAFVPPPVQHNHWRFEADHLAVFADIRLGDEIAGTVYLRHNLDELRERLNRYALIVMAVMMTATLAAYFLSRRLQHVISDPISHLANVAGAVATHKDYSVRAVKQGEDEVGRLIDGFNAMLEQIQERDNALKAAQETLEERVRERTRELHNEVLERRRTENERDRFFTLSLDMLCIGGMDGYYRRVNPAFESILGYGASELLPRPFIEVVHEDDRASTMAEVRRLAEGKAVANFEHRCVCKDGSTRWVAWCAAPVPEEGLFYACGRDITERKNAEEELEKVNRELLDTSRQAGMAEVATGVLHNVGNVLNSVNVSATVLSDNLRKSKSANLARVATMFREHATDLGAFVTSDSKGKQLPAYLGELAGHLAREQDVMLGELELLRKNIEHSKDIVAMQQSYAKVSGVSERVRVTELVEDALRMNTGALARHDVQISREYDPHDPEITVDRHKVLQILVNLIRNAKYACDESGRNDKRLTVRVINGDDRVRIAMTDNGVGIPAENLTRIFSHGFTTRKDGHGFGLHSGAIAARELGGALRVHSEGPGWGATFTLDLPLESTRTNA